MARYNSWANRRLYDAASALTRQDYFADKGAFFKSVHGTLNHLLVADRIWMARFTGIGAPAARLDAILFSELTNLRRAREAEDAKIIEYIAGLGDADLTSAITYRRASTPENFVQELKLALVHFFNHQTHHRGQVHAILTALVGHAPELDHLFFQRASG